MTSLETWKRTQKKNERRRAIGKRRVAHRRLVNRIPMSDRTDKIMRKELDRLSRLNPSKATKKQEFGLFNKIKSIFTKKSQRGS